MSLFTIAIVPEKSDIQKSFDPQILQAIQKVAFRESKILTLESYTTSLDYTERKKLLEEEMENKIQKMKKKGLSEAKIDNFVSSQERKNYEILREMTENQQKIERKILDLLGKYSEVGFGYFWAEEELVLERRDISSFPEIYEENVLYFIKNNF